MEPSEMEAADKAGTVRPRVRRGRYLPAQESLFQPVPWWLWGFAAVGVGWGFFTPNPLLTVCSLLMLPLLAGLLWFKGEPPVLLFACCIQWMQATMGVFYSNFQHLSLDAVPEIGSTGVEEATWLSMAGVLVLAVGMRAVLFKRDKRMVQQAQQDSRVLQIERVFILYLITFAFSAFIGVVAWAVPRLTQPLLAFSAIRWVLAFLLMYSVIANRRQYALLWFTVCLEVLAGLTAFFAEFKSIFYIWLIALAGTGFMLRGWRLVQFMTVAALLIVLAILWTGVKGDYREFVNQGTGQQTVNVPVGQRLEEIGELTSSITPAKFEKDFYDLMLRTSYVKFFALTIQNVPSNIPYEKGQLWWGSIRQVLMPRLLFPNKPAISDSARTSYYTGVDVAGVEQGTSIGIGYMGESYIDFGPAGMFAPIFVLGMFYGSIYRLFIAYSKRKIIGLAIAVSILVIGGCQIETSNIKIIGGNVVVCLAMALVLKFGETTLWDYVVRPAGRRAKRSKLKAEMLKS